MIDIKLLREQPEQVLATIAHKKLTCDTAGVQLRENLDDFHGREG
jgi:hypothetical protein